MKLPELQMFEKNDAKSLRATVVMTLIKYHLYAVLMLDFIESHSFQMNKVSLMFLRNFLRSAYFRRKKT